MTAKKNKKRYTDKEDELIKNLYWNDYSYVEIQNKLHWRSLASISHRIYLLIRKGELMPRKTYLGRSKNFTEAEICAIHDMRNSGMLYSDIAIVMDRNISSIHVILNKI
jgi:hypothetical protein